VSTPRASLPVVVGGGEARLRKGYPRALVASACAGLALANVARVGGAPIVLLALAAALATVFAADWRARVALAAAVLLLTGWWWASVRLGAIDSSVLVSRVGEASSAVVVVTGPATRGLFELRVPARLSRFGSLVASEPVLLELPLGRAPPQGAILALHARLEEPRPPSNGFDERTWLRRHGVHVVVGGSSWRIIGRRSGLGGYADRVRAWLAGSVARGARGERRAVLEGILLGEDQGLSPDLKSAFRASGLYHLLAVSGQNVAFVAFGVLLLTWLLGFPRWLGEIGALAGIATYVLAVGAQPSVIRAGVAGALGSLAWLSSRQRDRWHFLLLGALILLAWNPYNLYDAGFQLSFAAVAAIFFAVPRLRRLLEGYPVPRPAVDAIAVSLACGVATAPILWFQFGRIPVYSVPANALAAPVVAPLLTLAFAAALVAPVWQPAAAVIAHANGWLAAYLAGCARLVGGLPGATVSSVRGVALLVAIAALALLLSWLRGRGRWLCAGACATAAVALVVWHVWPRPAPPPPTGLRVSFLDVGQGDSTLLQVPQGAVLVDQGPPEARVAAQLARLGVRRLAAIVLTHPQRDHVGGAAQVLRKIHVGFVLDPRIPAPSRDEDAALDEASAHHVRVVSAVAGEVFDLGRLRLQVMWPRDPGPAGQDPNQHAVVILASYGRTDVLLTADAESDVTLPLRLPPVEVLKVAHHGSADSGLPSLLDRLRPQVAVIEVGPHNDYGHPTASTLAALAAAPGLSTYRTDLDGRVVLESDGSRIEVRTER
jgi:competence protein ComEC